MRDSEPDAYGESNSHIDADSYTNADGGEPNSHIHANSYTNGDGNSYVYSDSHCDGNCHIHSDGDRDGHGDSNCDRIAAAYSITKTSSNTAATTVRLVGCS
jgi:hypothetical protein